MNPLLPSLPSLPLQDSAQDSVQDNIAGFNAHRQPSPWRKVGRFCEKILIVCCLMLFFSLLAAALFNASAAADSSRVANDARFASHREVKTLLLQAIRKKAWSGRYETGRLRLTLPSDFPAKGRLRLHSLLWDEPSRRFSALVEVSRQHQFTTLDFKTQRKQKISSKKSFGKVSLVGLAIPYVRVLAARRALLYGTRITHADLKMVELPMSRKLRAALTEPRQALGMEIRFRRKAGEVLRAKDLRPARLVQRRSMVQVAYQHEGVRVVLQAQALNDGAHGQTVRLRNKFSGREFSAVVDGAGHARVISETAMLDPLAGQGDRALKLSTNASTDASTLGATGEQNPLGNNPFRADRQRRYDTLLNQPLSNRKKQWREK